MIRTGAPYEKELTNGIMSLQGDLDYAFNFFRLERRKEEAISNKELMDLQNKIR